MYLRVSAPSVVEIIRAIRVIRGRRECMALRRSHDRIIAGVCGGIAESLGWNPTHLRIVYALVSLLSAAFPGIIVYLVLWFLMPPPER